MLFKTIIILWLLFFLLLIIITWLWVNVYFDNQGYEYAVKTSFWFWFAIFIIQMILLYLVTYNEKYANKSLLFSIIALILPIIWYFWFYKLNPDYVYDNSDASGYYADKYNMYVEDVEEYKKYIIKYWFTRRKTRLLKSANDHVEMLKFASTYWEDLYEATTKSALAYDIENVFKEYNNRTFELLFIKIITKNISNVYYQMNHPGNADYNWIFLMHEDWPFVSWLRYLANNSNYPDVKEHSKKLIDSYDYYLTYNDDFKVNQEIIQKFWRRWWFQYWDDIETESEKFYENATWLENNYQLLWWIHYDEIMGLKEKMKYANLY